jgi:hypothetical protein
MAYTSSPATSTSDALRLAIGDTSLTVPILADAEVSYYIATYGANLKAASYAAAAIAAKYAPQVNQGFAEGNVSLDQLFSHFTALADRLMDQYNRGMNSFTVPAASEIGVIRDSLASNYPARQHISDILPEEFGAHEV